MEAEKVDQAFRKLSYRDQTLLEQRNAICMNCGRVSSMSTQTPFETLAALFEGSGASGAERGYKRAVEKLTLQLVELGQLHCVRLKQKSVQRKGKKITAAVYAYQVDNDGEWGEIQFDLVEKSAWVEVFAENDPCDTWEITDCAINAVLECCEGKLPKLLHCHEIKSKVFDSNKYRSRRHGLFFLKHSLRPPAIKKQCDVHSSA